MKASLLCGIDRDLLEGIKTHLLAQYRAQLRADVYLGAVTKAISYLRHAPAPREMRPGVYAVISGSDLRRLKTIARDDPESVAYEDVLVHEATDRQCSCFEYYGYVVRATCVHQEIVKIWLRAQHAQDVYEQALPRVS